MSTTDPAFDPLVELLLRHGTPDTWPNDCKTAFGHLFGSDSGRYAVIAQKEVTLRSPQFKTEAGVPYAGFIHHSNPDSGPYGGMSVVIFPVENAPALLSFVVGTQGLSPDEEVLGRPGHARKVQAICAWLNAKYGRGRLVAWAKEDPVRTDQGFPANVAQLFPAYQPVFKRYGNELYGIYAPVEDRMAASHALAAFLDVMFEERGHRPLSKAQAHSDDIRADWFQHLMPDTSAVEIAARLRERRFVILQGPPGTGKTYTALQLLRGHYQSNGRTVQFHPSTTYEHFVGGLAPVQTQEALGLSFAPQMGYLMEAAHAASKEPAKPYLLHVDEINRADLSKVLGEAVFLLEAGEAEARSLTLPYDFGPPFRQHLKLPANLHILGTMNSADRSIAIVDVAVRRRFAFLKLWPQLRVVRDHGGSFMEKAFVDLTSIFVEHASREAFDLMPGHSYFLEKDESAARRRLKITVAPLLEEYLAQGYVAGFAEPIRSYLQWLESL
jgi:5-methylcytosine-specific restriction protein B